MTWFDWFFKSVSRQKGRNERQSRPPFDLLDRVFRLPDGAELKVVGYQSGGKFLSAPFVLHCRIMDTGEVVLIDTMFIRHFGTDITPNEIRRVAPRTPHPRDQEEVLRIIGWSSKTDYENGVPIRSHLVPITDQEGGEGDAP